jgi:hypothetical protein
MAAGEGYPRRGIMEEARQTTEDAVLARLVEQIREGPAEVMRLPDPERSMAELALTGHDVHSIAQHVGMSERAVWEFLESLARTISGNLPARPTEVAGLGADLDPGVTGGYGDTGFGSIGAEPPIPVTEEEEEG